MAEKIRAVLILEIMGKPAEHIKKTLSELVDKLGKERGVTIIKKDVREPKRIEPRDKEGKEIKIQQDIFTTFSEVEIEVGDLTDLAMIGFNYMPSHIEIISPSDIGLKNFDASAILTGIIARLHQYDAITKNALMQNNILKGKIQEYMKVNPPKENIV